MPTEGYEQFREMALKLKRGVSPTRKSVTEMTLPELLVTQEKYLAWVSKYPDHPERSVKEHVYNTYILRRIEDLQQIEDVSVALGA